MVFGTRQEEMSDELLLEEIRIMVEERRSRKILPDYILLTVFSRKMKAKHGIVHEDLVAKLNELRLKNLVRAHDTMHGKSIELL